MHQARVSGIDLVPDNYFTTDAQKAPWQDRSKAVEVVPDKMGTVGAVALDVHGNLAGAGLTSGVMGKPKGRVGDTAYVHAGNSADKNIAVAW